MQSTLITYVKNNRSVLVTVILLLTCVSAFAEPAIEVLDPNFAAPDAEKGLLWLCTVRENGTDWLELLRDI